MEFNNNKSIDDNLPAVYPDNDKMDDSIAEGQTHSVLVVSIIAFGISLMICTICAICNTIFQYIKEKLIAERDARAERRRHRLIRDSYSPPPRLFLPSTSAKRVSPRASNRPTPDSINSSTSYRNNFLRGLSIDSNRTLPNSIDSSTSYRTFLRGLRIDSDNSLYQNERSDTQLRSFQSGIVPSIESNYSLQQNEPSTSYTRCFLRRYGINTELSNESEQNESNGTSFKELRSYQRCTQSNDSESSLQQNKFNAANEQSSFPRRFDQNINLDNPQLQNESSAVSSYELRSLQSCSGQSIESDNAIEQTESRMASFFDQLRSFLKMVAPSNLSNTLQQNEPHATSSYELRSFQRRLDGNTETDNSRQQRDLKSVYSDELPTHERNIDVLLPTADVTVARRTRLLSEGVNGNASKTEDTTIKRYSAP